MTDWSTLTAEQPELAAAVQSRFNATGLAFLATRRADGRPRISGVEPLFALGALWLGMMPGSRKAADLHRDPRLALHAASIDKEVRAGDAKMAGTAVAVTDEAEQLRYLAALEGTNGSAPSPPLQLFRVDIDEMVLIQPATDHLVITTWHEGRGTDRIERR